MVCILNFLPTLGCRTQFCFSPIHCSPTGPTQLDELVAACAGELNRENGKTLSRSNILTNSRNHPLTLKTLTSAHPPSLLPCFASHSQAHSAISAACFCALLASATATSPCPRRRLVSSLTFTTATYIKPMDNLPCTENSKTGALSIKPAAVFVTFFSIPHISSRHEPCPQRPAHSR